MRRACSSVLFAVLCSACATQRVSEVHAIPADSEEARSSGIDEAPPDFVRESEEPWVRLNSGEWLRGKLTVLSRQTLEFSSQELGDLRLDWDDVWELHTSTPFTLVLEDQSVHTGPLRVHRDLARVTTAAGERLFRRSDIQRIVRDVHDWRDFWSGRVKVGFTARRGNTEQTDGIVSAAAIRRSATSRLETTLAVLQSDQGGVETANNQRATARYDRFLTSRLYVTPLGVEAYRDRFQNIALRLTPYSAVGYTLIHRGPLVWDVSAGPGYRWTRFDSAPAGEEEDEEWVFVLNSKLSADLTAKLALEAAYSTQMSVEDLARTQHNATLKLSYDLWADLDFDVGFTWTRVGDPEPDTSGNTPEPDDYRLDVGLAWTF